MSTIFHPLPTRRYCPDKKKMILERECENCPYYSVVYGCAFELKRDGGAAERWPFDKNKCIVIQEIFTRNELMDNPDLQLKLNVEIYEDAISAACPYGPIRIGCDIIHKEQRKKSPKGMTGKAFRHLTPPMCYQTIKALMKAYLYWCAAETITDLAQRLKRDLKWEVKEVLPLLEKLLNETLTRLSSDLRWER